MPSRLQHKKLRVEYVDIKRLKKWQNNPRTMPDDQAAALQANLKEFDFADPLVIDQNNRVVGGHQRLDAAIALGYKQVPCVRRHLTERQFKTLNLALNKISGEWDNEKLAGILDELSKTADIALTGFSDQEVNMIIEGIQKDADSTELEDKVPPLPTKAQTKPGQLWKLGPHRLLCGDATDPASWERLMDGKKAVLCITDPPYEASDFAKYNCKPFSKPDAIRLIGEVMKPGSWLTWLDVREPVYSGKTWTLRGIIGIAQSGNTRYRGLLLLERKPISH